MSFDLATTQATFVFNDATSSNNAFILFSVKKSSKKSIALFTILTLSMYCTSSLNDERGYHPPFTKPLPMCLSVFIISIMVVSYLCSFNSAFFKIIDKHRSPHLWKKEKGQWKLRHQVS